MEKIDAQSQTDELNENDSKNHEFKKKIHDHNNIFKNSFFKNYILDSRFKKIYKSVMGNYYSIVHKLIMFMGLFLIMFSNNLVTLNCVLFILFLDSISNIIIYDCPLTMLEKSYLGTSFTSTRLEVLQNMGILYSNSLVYDTQLEIIINVSSACIFKILGICFLRYFEKKI